MTNDAAVDLTNEIILAAPDPRIRDRLIAMEQKALAAAKAEGAREAVERIRSVLWGNGFSPVSADVMRWIDWRLDEEAAR